MSSKRVKVLVAVALLSSMAYVLMLFKFPIPPFPSFLKIDFSEIPALIGTIVFGPMAGITIELLKNVLDYVATGSETGIPIGHFANFVSGVTFILPTYFIYNKLKTKKGMTTGLMTGTSIMAILMSILNYYVLLPAYSFFLNWPAMSSPEIRQYIMTGVLPFNMVKGVLISIIFLVLYTKIGVWIQKQRAAFQLG